MNRLFLSSLLFFLYLHRVSTIDVDIKAAVPNAIDWRNRGKVNKIKNRGTCKASWAFAITSALETTYAVKFNTLFDLSEQHLIDCVSDNSRGCDYGDTLYGAMYVKRKGIMKTDKYPYKASDSQSCGYQARYSVKAPNFYYYTDDEDGLRDIVSTIGPVVVGIKLPASAQNFTSGEFKDKACENVNWFDSINEYMTIVGYGTFNLTQPFWVLRHSLGSSWGRNGYLYLPRGSNYCGLMIEPLYFEYV